MIERLHDDIIAVLLSAANCSIQFTTTKRHNNKSPRSGWKEHVAMYRAKAMNWHALWLSCGCPSEAYVFNMRKATRSTCHKQIKYIEQNEDMIRKDRLSNELLSKDMSQFWRSVTELRGKSKQIVILLMILLMIMMFLNIWLTRMKMFLIKWVLTVLT